MSHGNALAVPAFRRIWAAGLISDAGDWLLFVALPLVVFQLSGSATATAFAFIIELVPAVALAPVAARLADRVDRRILLATVNVLQAIALLPLLLVDSAADLPILYAVIATQAGLASIFEPAKNALMPTLVGPGRLTSANALVGLNQDLGRLIGGPLGGVLLVVGGLPMIVVIDAITCLASAALVFSVRAPRPPRDGVETPHGILAALGSRRLRGVFLSAAAAGAAQGLFVVLFVIFVIESLDGSEADVGLLRGIQAIGAIAAGLVLGFIVKVAAPRRLVVAGAIAFGIVSLTVWNLPALTTSLGFYVALFIIVGAPGVLLITGMVGTIQSVTSDSQRGSAFAAFGLASAVGQMAGMLAAALVDAGVPLIVLLQIQGALYLASGLIALAMLRGDRPATPAPLPPV